MKGIILNVTKQLITILNKHFATFFNWVINWIIDINTARKLGMFIFTFLEKFPIFIAYSYKVFQSNKNNLPTDLSGPRIGPWQVLPLKVRVDPGVMTMKEYTPLPAASELALYRQM